MFFLKPCESILGGVEQGLMGVVHPSSEGVPGGLSAGGQRRRMAGCGAPSRIVSRLSPSIPRTFPVKRLKRYSAASLLTASRSFSPFVLCTSFCLSRSAEHNPTSMHVTQTCTAWVINCFHCEPETLGSRSSCSVSIHPENSKLAYYNRPGWLCSQPEDGEPVLCAFFLKLFFFLSIPPLPDYLSVPPFLTHSCISINSTSPSPINL